MQVETQTRYRVSSKGKLEVIVKLLLKPRGSGNKHYAARLAKAFRDHPIMAPHISKVVAGTSSVTVHVVPSVACMRAINEVARTATVDVPGQMLLPGLATG